MKDFIWLILALLFGALLLPVAIWKMVKNKQKYYSSTDEGVLWP